MNKNRLIKWFGVEMVKADIARSYHVSTTYFARLCKRKNNDCCAIYEDLDKYTNYLYSRRIEMFGDCRVVPMSTLSNEDRSHNLNKIAQPTEWERVNMFNEFRL